MRELTKSMMSFFWAVPLYGMRQAINLALPQEWNKATRSFDAVTAAAKDELGEAFQGVFDAGDRLQRSMVNMTVPQPEPAESSSSAATKQASGAT